MVQRYDYSTQRLYVTFDLGIDVVVSINRSQANYLLNVLRMKTGSRILLFNGRQGEWLGEIEEKGRKSCVVRLLSQSRIQPEPYNLVYLFAPLKKGRLDYMVQKAVEMGAGSLQPVITQHTQIAKLNLERLRANILEAAEQCGILTIPEIHDPIALYKILADWDKDRSIIYCDEAAEKIDGIEMLQGLCKKNLALLVGPEGGFSEEERITLRLLDFVYPISLGPRILRADTAAVAAFTIVQAVAGDW
ncbi:MAG: 16S rRNA (uracil(1498)-N(3))-methyltransferase [Hyphomicrobiales bacterium]|nr:16S rRNA (uracil(1498)-N(3))-methyltransferase [Hyphomicrobiales bacterium]